MSYKKQIAEAKKLLSHALTEIRFELENYPTPIAGCDAQYNHLLAERAKIEAALKAIGKDVFVATPRQLNPFDRIEQR